MKDCLVAVSLGFVFLLGVEAGADLSCRRNGEEREVLEVAAGRLLYAPGRLVRTAEGHHPVSTPREFDKAAAPGRTLRAREGGTDAAGIHD